jgi:phosphatidylglycerophosphate synthase
LASSFGAAVAFVGDNFTAKDIPTLRRVLLVATLDRNPSDVGWPDALRLKVLASAPHTGKGRIMDALRTRVLHDARQDWPYLVLTLGRLAFIPFVIVEIHSRWHIAAAITLFGFLVADYFDGIVARRGGADGPARRAFDSTSDRIAIWSVYIAMTAFGYVPLALLAIMLVRDLYCVRLCQRAMQSRYVAVGADWPYRGLNAALAAWVMAAPVMSSPIRTTLLGVILGFSFVVAADLRRAVRHILTAPPLVGSIVVSAGDVRTLSALATPGRIASATIAALRSRANVLE